MCGARREGCVGLLKREGERGKMGKRKGKWGKAGKVLGRGAGKFWGGGVNLLLGLVGGGVG